MFRRRARKVKIGNVFIGGDAPVAIQGMTKTDTRDVDSTVRQIRALQKRKCEIVRVAVPDRRAVQALRLIKAKIDLPLVADMHFSKELAILAIRNGADKIRLNPGNIYKKEQITEIIRTAKNYKIPIRIGINSGSLRKRSRKSIADEMVTECLDYLRIFERLEFYDIVISLKSSDVKTTITAYEKMAQVCSYPFHLGITATGPLLDGIIKSSLGIGRLLLSGIGDTIRVSLNDSPLKEVEVAKGILQNLGLRHFMPQIISCPTCGRTKVDISRVVRELRARFSKIDYPKDFLPFKIAVMGCMVNGPGEAKEADIGIAFGKNKGVLFRYGERISITERQDLIPTILREVEKCIGRRRLSQR